MAKDKVHSICGSCAKKNGGVWPEGHVATFWSAKCDVCDIPKALCDVDDFNWPKGKPKDWVGTGRD